TRRVARSLDRCRLAARPGLRLPLVERSLLSHVAHLRERVLEFVDPRRFVLLDEAYAPRERVRAAPCHARANERVEELPLRQTQSRHHRYGHVREERGLIASLRAPGEVLPEPLACLVRDLDSLVTGALAEALDRPFLSSLRGVPATGRLHVRKGADDPDLVLIHANLGRPCEPVLREPTRQPAFDLFGCRHVLPPVRFHLSENM